jgi:hypothetical protein
MPQLRRKIQHSSVMAQFEIQHNCGVIPKPRAFTGGARNLLENGLAERSFTSPEKRLRSG